MFRATTGQDRPIQRDLSPLVGRILRPVVIAWGGGGVLVIALVLMFLGVSSTGASVSRSRIEVATVERGNFVRDVAAEGKIVATVSPMLYAPSAGTVTLLVRAGDKVSQGTELLKIDSPDLEANLLQERATLENARFEYESARTDARMHLMLAQESHARALVERNTASRELQRSRKAFELGAYSELQVLRAEDALVKAESALAQAQTVLEVQPSRGQFTVNSRKAILTRQQQLVADLERQVDALTVRSPVDGQVGQVQVMNRAFVAKQAPLLTIVDLSALEVEISVPESLSRDLVEGMSANLSGAGGEWRGSLSSVSPEVISGQVTARVRFDGEKPQKLRQSQRMSVRIVLDRRENVLMVERGNFVEQNGAIAYVVNADQAVKKPIRVGAVSVDKVEILSGLAPGDRIVIAGTEAFNRADRVTLSN